MHWPELSRASFFPLYEGGGGACSTIYACMHIAMGHGWRQTHTSAPSLPLAASAGVVGGQAGAPKRQRTAHRLWAATRPLQPSAAAAAAALAAQRNGTAGRPKAADALRGQCRRCHRCQSPALTARQPLLVPPTPAAAPHLRRLRYRRWGPPPRRQPSLTRRQHLEAAQAPPPSQASWHGGPRPTGQLLPARRQVPPRQGQAAAAAAAVCARQKLCRQGTPAPRLLLQHPSLRRCQGRPVHVTGGG